jgi:hypothetical protein
MSTSLLYHAFTVRGYRYVKTEYIKGEVIFTIKQPRESYQCPACGSKDVLGRGGKRRRFRTVSIGGKSVYLVLMVPRVECRCCSAVRQVKIAFADPRVTYTKSFQQYALELSGRTMGQWMGQWMGQRGRDSLIYPIITTRWFPAPVARRFRP